MELREGTITDTTNRTLTDNMTGTPNIVYDNPAGVDVKNGDKVNYIVIIASTPQGTRVINILKERVL